MFFMGILNLDGVFFPRNLAKASYYLKESGNDEYKNSYVALGFLYHVGFAFKQDIQKAIKYYKEASSFRNCYAKNNLGIIYKHGFNEIKKELNTAIIYFQEAINQNNDIIAMYNLANLYFYEEPFKDSFKESIKLLIKSSNKKFYHSTLLLCIISIINFGFEYENIIKELNEYEMISHELKKSIYNILVLEKLDDITVFENRFNQLRDNDFVYNHHMHPILIENEIIITQLKKNEIIKDNCKNVNSDFYKGFGI